MPKKMIHVEVDEETYARLQELAHQIAKERGDYRLGVSTVIFDLIQSFLAEDGKADADDSPKRQRKR